MLNWSRSRFRLGWFGQLLHDSRQLLRLLRLVCFTHHFRISFFLLQLAFGELFTRSNQICIVWWKLFFRNRRIPKTLRIQMYLWCCLLPLNFQLQQLFVAGRLRNSVDLFRSLPYLTVLLGNPFLPFTLVLCFEPWILTLVLLDLFETNNLAFTLLLYQLLSSFQLGENYLALIFLVQRLVWVFFVFNLFFLLFDVLLALLFNLLLQLACFLFLFKVLKFLEFLFLQHYLSVLLLNFRLHVQLYLTT